MSRVEKAILKLRDLAVSVAETKGRVIEDDDGTHAFRYCDERLRVRLQPPIRGSSNPTLVDVWRISDKPVLVLSVMWGDHDEVVLTYVGGSWEDALRAASGVKKKLAAPGVLAERV